VQDGDRQADGLARARWRFRDLQARERWYALAMVCLILVPFAVSLTRAFRAGWMPSGDVANIATRALDVFSHHPPLTGLPSTSELYGSKIQTNHPGPIEFYLLAVPLRVLGMTAGPLLTAAAINCTFVLLALWAFFRRLGPTAMLWAGVLLLAVMWSAGTSVLSDPLSSNMTMYSVLCTAVLAWALIDGDLALLPLAAFAASYAAQQHLAAGLIVLPLVVAAVAALTVQMVKRARRGDAAIKPLALRWGGVASVVAAVCWTPVIYDELTGHPGNLTAIVRFARDNTRRTQGLKSGVYQAVHAIAPPTILGRSDTTGLFFLNPAGALHLLLGLVIVGALAVVAWKSRGPTRALAFLALVLIAAAVVDGSNVPDSGEAARINLYRWSWAAALLTWAALGLGAAQLAGRVASRRSMTASGRRLVVPALFLVAALITAATVFARGTDDGVTDRRAFALERRTAAAVLARVDRARPVYVVESGRDATLSVGPYLIFRLVQAGVRVEVSSLTASAYGRDRLYRRSSGAAILVVTSGAAQPPIGPGELVTRQPFGPAQDAEFDSLSATRGALVRALSAAAMGVTMELTPRGRALVRAYSPLQQYALNTDLSTLATAPHHALSNPDFLDLVLAGGLRSPRFDPAQVRRLLDVPSAPYHGVWGDEQVQVRLFGAGQLTAAADV
jgi:hypothetical protein